jgi:iron(II)-dependent oxidoreductase
MAARSVRQERVAAELGEVRERALALVGHLPAQDLERVLDPVMSPLVWDLAHIAAYEDLWLAHRLGGLDLLHPELAAMCDAFETPRAVRGDLPLLDAGGARAYPTEVRERTLGVLAGRGPGDGTLVELVVQDELQHTETMRSAWRSPGSCRPACRPSRGAAAGSRAG